MGGTDRGPCDPRNATSFRWELAVLIRPCLSSSCLLFASWRPRLAGVCRVRLCETFGTLDRSSCDRQCNEWSDGTSVEHLAAVQPNLSQ